MNDVILRIYGVVVLSLAMVLPAQAQTSIFLENFNGGAEDWADESYSGATHHASGGHDGGAYISVIVDIDTTSGGSLGGATGKGVGTAGIRGRFTEGPAGRLASLPSSSDSDEDVAPASAASRVRSSSSRMSSSPPGVPVQHLGQLPTSPRRPCQKTPWSRSSCQWNWHPHRCLRCMQKPTSESTKRQSEGASCNHRRDRALGRDASRDRGWSLAR